MTVDASGFAPMTLADLRASLRARVAASPLFGPGAQTGADTVLGQLIDCFAGELADAWDALQALYDARRADAAPGSQLDDICALVGVLREPASPSRVTLTFTVAGAAGTIPAGTRVRVPDGPEFLTSAEATWSAPGTLAVDAESALDGAIAANIGEITELVDLPAGVTAVTNAAAPLLGQSREPDALLRARRESSLAATGGGSEAALQAALLALVDVDAAVVRSNRTDAAVDGDPPHSLHVVVWPVSSTAPIFEVLHEQAPAGIRMMGDEVDADVAFDFATELPVFCHLVLSVDDAYPVDGDTIAAAAVEAYLGALAVGADAWPLRIVAAAVAACPGITAATLWLKVGEAPAGTDTAPIVAAWDELVTSGGCTVEVV